VETGIKQCHWLVETGIEQCHWLVEKVGTSPNNHVAGFLFSLFIGQ
jgi:hypothetical protein